MKRYLRQLRFLWDNKKAFAFTKPRRCRDASFRVGMVVVAVAGICEDVVTILTFGKYNPEWRADVLFTEAIDDVEDIYYKGDS